MKKNAGFTLTELIVLITIVIIAALMLSGVIGNDQNVNWSPYTGYSETTCEGGYKVIKSQRGHVTQLLDDQGHGIKCSSV